jgi:Fic family protein
MTKKEKIQALRELIERRKAWIEKYANDNEISDRLKAEIFREVEEEIKHLEELIEYYEQSTKTEKRKSAAANATAEREKRVKEKIQNAVNLLKMEGKEITPYQVAKTAGISYNTAKKYLNT